MTNAWDDMEKAKEGQYFKKKDKECLEKKHKEVEREEFEKHFKCHCPKCGDKLVEEDFHGVKIDKCPSCKGIWLDDGELDALKDEEKARTWFDNFWGNK